MAGLGLTNNKLFDNLYQHTTKTLDIERPERFSLNIHPGLQANSYVLDALEVFAPHIDMVRLGNAIRFPNGDPRNQEHDNIVIENDPFLQRAAGILGWDRITMVINNKNDFATPSIEDAVNDQETGFVQRTLRAFPQVKFAQIYNEPCNFDGLCGGTYVRHLKAAYEWIQEENQRRRAENEHNKQDKTYVPKAIVQVISAATFGMSSGVPEFRRDLEAGLQDCCDIVAVHDYTSALCLEYASLRREWGFQNKALWLTETGFPTHTEHVAWYQKLVGMERDLNDGYVANISLPENPTEEQIEEAMKATHHHIFWYSFNEGNDRTPGKDQYGLIEEDRTTGVGWRPTNNDMFNTVLARPISPYCRGVTLPASDVEQPNSTE